jgi:hypothetical protein
MDVVLDVDPNLDVFRIANSARRARLEFRHCRRVSTHAARDNQPEWIAAGTAAGHFPLSMGYF